MKKLVGVVALLLISQVAFASYKIKSTEVVDVSLRAQVDYTLSDGSTQKATVDIFMPKTKEDALNAIASREQTEEAKLIAVAKTKEVKTEVDKEIHSIL
jgi:hypothetical protein